MTGGEKVMRPRRAPGVVFEVLDDRAVLVDAAGRELITLNETGTLVWEALDGRRDTAALVDTVRAVFDDVDPATVERDVARFLAELVELGVAVPD